MNDASQDEQNFQDFLLGDGAMSDMDSRYSLVYGWMVSEIEELVDVLPLEGKYTEEAIAAAKFIRDFIENMTMDKKVIKI